jgi:hypothetical protein
MFGYMKKQLDIVGRKALKYLIQNIDNQCFVKLKSQKTLKSTGRPEMVCCPWPRIRLPAPLYHQSERITQE